MFFCFNSVRRVSLSFVCVLLSTRSTHGNGMKEFEMELQELFNEVKAMVKIGNERDAMDLLRANYVAVKEEIDSGLKGIQQAALLDIIALGYMAVGDLKPVPALLDMVSLSLISEIIYYLGGLCCSKTDVLTNADKQDC